MTDDELNALLANAKPSYSESRQVWWFGYQPDPARQSRGSIPDRALFEMLPTEAMTYANWTREFATEAAAMDALRAAVERYKESRT